MNEIILTLTPDEAQHVIQAMDAYGKANGITVFAPAATIAGKVQGAAVVAQAKAKQPAVVEVPPIDDGTGEVGTGEVGTGEVPGKAH